VTTPGLVLQHDPDVPPALLGEWLETRGIPWRLAELWHEPVPTLGSPPFLATLGSRESAAASAPAFVPQEIELLRAAVAHRVPVIGVCFGGQALAVALGAEIHRARPPEVGWDEIESLDPEAIPPGRWLNYHFESFTLPPGAKLLARSAAGPAAFRLGPHLGLQFHAEATPELANAWAANDHQNPSAVDAERLAAEGELYGAEAAGRLVTLLDRWWRRRARG
jgi:GMP synthase-like glutamine amidotransferase